MDEKFMKLAIKEAKKSYINGDVPVGAVIVKNGKIISRAHNKKEKNKIATNHAEIIAINKACKKLNNWHLDDCVLYVTLEPCLMCIGAIIQCHIKNIVYSAKSEKFGAIESRYRILEQFRKKEKYIIKKGLFSEITTSLLVSFFQDKRK